MTIIVVSGTDTDVGKTVATAAIAAAFRSAGRRVTAYKPTQTGVVADEAGDISEVERLSGIAGRDGVRLTAAMAPRPAAALESAVLPSLDDHVGRVVRLAESHDVVLVEGAGGLLVELTEAGETVADLARALDAPVVVVVRSALGTLNHTALTLEALHARGVRTHGLIIGSWPDDPSTVETSNMAALMSGRVPVLGAIPSGAGQLGRDAFSSSASRWLPDLMV